jgi:hypothetical protein
MKYSFLIVPGGIALLALLAAGCTAPSQSGAAPPGVTVTPAVPLTCGLTSCHGLDLACGRDPPQVCTAMYQLGDKCRQYAYCSDASGTCTLVRTTAFDTCKSCIERCGGADATELLTCEEKC